MRTRIFPLLKQAAANTAKNALIRPTRNSNKRGTLYGYLYRTIL